MSVQTSHELGSYARPGSAGGTHLPPANHLLPFATSYHGAQQGALEAGRIQHAFFPPNSAEMFGANTTSATADMLHSEARLYTSGEFVNDPGLVTASGLNKTPKMATSIAANGQHKATINSDDVINRSLQDVFNYNRIGRPETDLQPPDAFANRPEVDKSTPSHNAMPQSSPIASMNSYFSSKNFFHDALMHAAGKVDSRGVPYPNMPQPPLQAPPQQPVLQPHAIAATEPISDSECSEEDSNPPADEKPEVTSDATKSEYPQYAYDRLDYAASQSAASYGQSLSKLEQLNERLGAEHLQLQQQPATVEPPQKNAVAEDQKRSPECGESSKEPRKGDPESYIQHVISSTQRGAASVMTSSSRDLNKSATSSPDTSARDVTPEYMRIGAPWSGDPPRKDEACTPSPPSSVSAAGTPARDAPMKTTPKRPVLDLPNQMGLPPLVPLPPVSPGAKLPVPPRQPDTPASFVPEAIIPKPNDEGGENGAQSYYCHLCSYVGHSKFHFNAHMSSHFEHRCPMCDYTSRTEGRLKRHIKDFHSENPPENFSGQSGPVESTAQIDPQGTNRGPKIYKCKQCEYQTTQKVEFWEHARTHIKVDKILQCPKCPFVTEYKHHLEYHLRNHFGSKPFKCSKCNYSCVNKSMLNSHMKSHTNVYQYRCANCTYATKYCHSLKLHLKKYNHQPATVLNQDGSLPVDGSGDFDLVSKRGPPRGPRHVKVTNSPGKAPVVLPGMVQQQQQTPPQLQPGFWPLFPGGIPPPLAPMGLNPLGGLQRNDGSCKTDKDPKQPDQAAFMNMFGLPDPMIEMAQNAAFAAMATKEFGGLKPPFPPAMWPLGLMGASPGEPPLLPGKPGPGLLPGMLDPQMMMQLSENGKHKRNLADNMREVAEMATNDNTDDVIEDTNDDEHEALDDAVKQEEDNDKRDDVQLGNMVAMEEPQTPVRKRSRKGKAFKLDSICLKLQERYSDLQEPQDNESSADGTESGDAMIKQELVEVDEEESSDDAATSSRSESGDVIMQSSKRKPLLPERRDVTTRQNGRHAQPEAHSCSICGISFDDVIMYSMHAAYHSLDNPWRCSMCGEESANKIDFFLHIARQAHS